MEKIYTGLVDKISELLGKIGFSSSDYMILEKVDDIRFENFRLENFENWEKGIIFSQNKELKWREIDGRFHAVFSGDNVSMDGFQDISEATTDEQDFPVVLWGQQSPEMQDFHDNEYIELPIPEVLSYPIKSTYRVKVLLKIQKNNDGEIIGYRFSKIVEETKNESL